jgi:hypothetical protein
MVGNTNANQLVAKYLSPTLSAHGEKAYCPNNIFKQRYVENCK